MEFITHQWRCSHIKHIFKYIYTGCLSPQWNDPSNQQLHEHLHIKHRKAARIFPPVFFIFLQGLVAKALMGFPNSSKETENESKLKPYGEFKQIGPLQLGVNWTVASDTGFRLDGDPSSPWLLTCPALSVCDHTLELSKK